MTGGGAAIALLDRQASEDIKDLKREDSSALSAIFVFAKCWQLGNLVYLRNLMNDQLYTANFRLHSLQILLQLKQKLNPTIFSRFVQGSIS